jgi:tetratricopeptide (TPR) repeat protein
MNRTARFWIFMAAFQLLFALGVFALTRAYYLDRAPQPSRISDAPFGAAAPHPMPSTTSGDPRGDLESLISSFPGRRQPARTRRNCRARATRHFGQQQYDRAAQFYEQALRAGSQDANDYNSLGLTLHYLGRSEEALAVLNEGVAVDPDYQRIWLTLGFVNSQLGNLQAAREALGTAVRMGPDNEIGHSAAEMLDYNGFVRTARLDRIGAVASGRDDDQHGARRPAGEAAPRPGCRHVRCVPDRLRAPPAQPRRPAYPDSAQAARCTDLSRHARRTDRHAR